MVESALFTAVPGPGIHWSKRLQAAIAPHEITVFHQMDLATGDGKGGLIVSSGDFTIGDHGDRDRNLCRAGASEEGCFTI